MFYDVKQPSSENIRDARDLMILQLREEGMTNAAIGLKFGMTKNAVIGLANRCLKESL